MAVAVIFTPTAMSTEQYDECMRRLEAAGAGRPAGRSFHVCHVSGGQLRVLDVWNSAAEFQEFGRTLMPILRELGIDPGLPEVCEIHNLVEG